MRWAQAYSPISPLDIPAVPPPAPPVDDYLRSRIERFYEDLADGCATPSLSSVKPSTACSAAGSGILAGASALWSAHRGAWTDRMPLHCAWLGWRFLPQRASQCLRSAEVRSEFALLVPPRRGKRRRAQHDREREREAREVASQQAERCATSQAYRMQSKQDGI